MKKNIVVVIIIIYIFLTSFTNYSLGVKSTNLDIDIIAKQNSNMSEEALNSLKQNFNYKGNVVGENMKLDTTITFIGESILRDGTYHIQIGNASDGVTGDIVSISKENLEKLGYNFDNPESMYGYQKSGNKIKWKVVLIADFNGNDDIRHQEGNSSQNDLHIHIREAYGGTEEDYNYGLNDVNPSEEEVRFGAEEHYDDVQENVENVFNFIENFKKNPMGTIFTIILDGSVEKIDVIQKIANAFQTTVLKTVKDNEIVYEYQYLKKDGTVGNSRNTDEGAGNRNKFTNVSRGSQNTGDESWQKIINVDITQTDFSSYGSYKFTRNTKIPVIVVDPYTMATSKISTFDVNFLVVNNNLHNPNDSIWIKIRNVWTLAIRVTIYITSAILVISLIIHGIILIINTTISPKQRKKHMDGLINFSKSCLMLVGTVIIMACAIYANEMFLPKVMTDGRVELPIRVNVEEAGYSFSTTDTGYVRYMAQIQNVDLCGIKFTYVFAYFFLALRNIAIAILMMIRTILMFGLAVLGPIIVLFYSLGQAHLLPIDYRGWVRWYISLAFIQVMLAFIFSFV